MRRQNIITDRKDLLRMRAKLFFSVLISATFLSCASKALDSKNFLIQTENGNSIYVNAEIARTDSERSQGYMNRTKIPDGTGMIFVFERDEILNFWMKNTPTPLSIAYIDSSGKIRNIFDMTPFSLEPVKSTVSVRYALEVPQGWFSKNKIKIGDKIDLSPLR